MVKDALKQWQAPGLALVIVQDDRVVYLKGFGVRDLGGAAPVGPDTVFPLASCTKPFTALAVAMLADDGKLGWDDPVRRHVPFFRLADPLADANCTLRDLLCHRTGVGQHDLLWYRAPWLAEERVRKIGLVEPEYPFRAQFQYQTVLFGTAGLAAGRAAGTSWDEVVRGRILEPLGMKTASCIAPGAGGRADIAAPHRADAAGKVGRIDRYPLDRPDPAGSIHASARDLGKFLRFQLGDGTWQGRRLVSAENLREPQTSQVVIRMEEFARAVNPETRFLTYGLGWIVQDYRGKQILMHGGAIDGFRAHLTLVPEARLGIGLLSNLDGALLNLALSNQLLDRYLGAPGKDWSGYYHAMQTEERRDAAARGPALRAAAAGRGPALPLAAYAGAYHDRAYGTCRVAVKDGRLHWSWAALGGPLEPVDGHTFLANAPAVVDAPFTFAAGPDGRAAALQALGRVFRRQE